MLAPIAIFAYNRPDSLQNLLESLVQNPEFKDSELHFFLDGPKSEKDATAVAKVKEIAESIPSATVHAESENKGLANNIIEGVSEILKTHESVIVLEDDLWCSPNFLQYMNLYLNYFKDDDRICSVCGYGLKIKRPKGYTKNIYLSNRSSSWGWGTWKRCWENVDWDVSNWETLKRDKKFKKSFNCGGSDMFSMLAGYMNGANNSWAIRFCLHQSLHELWSVHPFRSLIDNVGYGEKATNCNQKYSRFKVQMNDPHYIYSISENISSIAPNKKILSALRRYQSIPIRIYSKIRKILNL